MPTLISHAHCQSTEGSHTSPNLSKSIAAPTHGQNEKRKDKCTKLYLKLYILMYMINYILNTNLKRKIINQTVSVIDSLVA